MTKMSPSHHTKIIEREREEEMRRKGEKGGERRKGERREGRGEREREGIGEEKGREKGERREGSFNRWCS